MTLFPGRNYLHTVAVCRLYQNIYWRPRSIQALIHKNIPIRSVGIEIAPAYYEDYLKKLYPEAQINPVDAFRKIDQTSDFPEMSRLLTEIKDYRGEGIAAKLFYEGKVAEAVSMVVEYQKKHPDKPAHKLSQQDIENLQIVAAYLSDHYAFVFPWNG